MPQNVITLIVGAAIALLSSLITTIVSNHYEFKHKTQEHTWQEDARKRAEQKEVVDQRYEKVLISIDLFLSRLYETKNAMIRSIRQLNFDGLDIKEINKFDEDQAYTTEIDQLLAAVYSFGEPELVGMAKELKQKYLDFIYNFSNSLGDINKDDFDETTVEKYMDEIFNIYSRFSYRLDTIRKGS